MPISGNGTSINHREISLPPQTMRLTGRDADAWGDGKGRRASQPNQKDGVYCSNSPPKELSALRPT